MEPEQVLPLRVRVDQGVMAVKGYLTFFISPEYILASYLGHPYFGRWSYSADRAFHIVIMPIEKHVSTSFPYG